MNIPALSSYCVLLQPAVKQNGGYVDSSLCSGRAYDDMLVAKLETVYTDSGDNGSSQVISCQLAFV